MLRLRPYKACDASAVVSWIGDETAFRKWCADRYDHYPITAEDINRHYDALADSDSFYQMTAFDETGVVGHMIMRFTDEKKSVLRFGFVIVDNKKRGMGYGKQMLQLAVRYAFDMLKADRITLGVFENNAAAYHCYKAAGFRDVVLEEPEYYHVLNEDWKCLELALDRRGEELSPADEISVRSERLSPGEYIDFLRRTDLGSQYPKERFEERIGTLVNSVSISLAARNKDGLLVGVLFGVTDFAYWLFVTDLGVARDYERRGIGKRLMQTALGLAGGERNIAVYLAANEKAVPFYEKLGMKRSENVMQYNHVEWTEFTVQ